MKIWGGCVPRVPKIRSTAARDDVVAVVASFFGISIVYCLSWRLWDPLVDAAESNAWAGAAVGDALAAAFAPCAPATKFGPAAAFPPGTWRCFIKIVIIFVEGKEKKKKERNIRTAMKGVCYFVD